MLSDTNVTLIDQLVSNPDAFFPDLNLQDWQELFRVPGDAPKTLERQMLLAMGDCNTRLAAYKTAQEAAGGNALPAAQALDYGEAVFAQATGLLIPLLPSIVTEERAREHLTLLQQTPGPFFDRANSRLGRITGAGLGGGRIKAAII